MPHNTVMTCQAFASLTLWKEHFATLGLPTRSAIKKKTFCQAKNISAQEGDKKGKKKKIHFLLKITA